MNVQLGCFRDHVLVIMTGRMVQQGSAALEILDAILPEVQGGRTYCRRRVRSSRGAKANQ
jgi:hypothetical protein